MQRLMVSQFFVPVGRFVGASGFPMFSAWVADHIEKITLHKLKSNAGPTCETPAGELETTIKTYWARAYARYKQYEYEYENQFVGSKSDSTNAKFHGLVIDLGQKVLDELHRISVPDLHSQTMLHIVYLRLLL